MIGVTVDAVGNLLPCVCGICSGQIKSAPMHNFGCGWQWHLWFYGRCDLGFQHWSRSFAVGGAWIPSAMLLYIADSSVVGLSARCTTNGIITTVAGSHSYAWAMAVMAATAINASVLSSMRV